MKFLVWIRQDKRTFTSLEFAKLEEMITNQDVQSSRRIALSLGQHKTHKKTEKVEIEIMTEEKSLKENQEKKMNFSLINCVRET